MLKCKRLSASWISGKKSFEVLNNVSVELNQGEFVCLSGPNGGGKSTLLKILSGLEGIKGSGLKITSAETEPEADVIKISTLNRRQIAQKISFMEQSEHSAWNMTVRNMILTGRYAWNGTNLSSKDYEEAEKSAEILGISPLLDRFVYSLSGGEFQKVRIARAVCQKPSYLLLDEPCAALDITSEPSLLETLKNLSRTQNMGILISIHNVNLAARFADRMILLPPHKSEISGTVPEVFTEKNLSETYGQQIQIFNHPVLNIPQIL